MDGNIILIVTYFKKTYITQPPAAGTLCWDEFLQLTIVLSVCIGFIQTGAFLFTENYLGHGQKFLVTPRGKCAFYLLSRKGAQLPPPLTLSPQDTLTCWEEDINAYGMHSSSPSNANVNAEMEVIAFPSR